MNEEDDTSAEERVYERYEDGERELRGVDVVKCRCPCFCESKARPAPAFKLECQDAVEQSNCSESWRLTTSSSKTGTQVREKQPWVPWEDWSL